VCRCVDIGTLTTRDGSVRVLHAAECCCRCRMALRTRILLLNAKQLFEHTNTFISTFRSRARTYTKEYQRKSNWKYNVGIFVGHITMGVCDY
jgi:hypothetical protein